MPQDIVWEKEYQNPQLVTKEAQPQKDVLKLFKYLRKEHKLELTNLNVLDLGCGTGRNSNYLAEMGNNVVGIEISPTALKLAEGRAKELNVDVDYSLRSMGETFRGPEGDKLKDDNFDLVINVTSSNSLNEKERDVYLSEVNRVLNKDGFFFVKALCKDGDKNVQALLKKFPGPEYDTYINKDMDLVERVFSKEDFEKLYGKYFEIIKMEKKTNYTKFKGQSYKRNFWLVVMKRRVGVSRK